MSTEASPERRPPAPPGGSGISRGLFTVRGVPVRLDPSVLVLVGLVMFSSYQGFASLGPVPALLASFAAAVLLLVSILLHELGHTLASLNRGIPVRSITLFALGGVTESTREARTAKDEFVIVGIGPFVSLVLSAVFGLLTIPLQQGSVVNAVVYDAMMINLALAIFNIVPGYPLDGGRLLRSILWQITGRPHQATRWAARVGQLFALLLIADGVADMFRLGVSIFPIRGGLFTALIGLFLFRGATDSHRAATFRERVGERTARMLMGSVPPALDPQLPVELAVARMQERPSLLWPVGDPLVGVTTLAELERVAPGERGVVPVGRVARSPEGATVSPDASLDEIVDRLRAAVGAMLLVVDEGGRPVGLLTPSLVTGAGRA